MTTKSEFVVNWIKAMRICRDKLNESEQCSVY